MWNGLLSLTRWAFREEEDHDRDVPRVVRKPARVCEQLEGEDGEGKGVGFILGDASGGEYGVPDTRGWIDTIGFQRGDMINLELKI
jgi:hypothetical protein